MTSYRTFRAAVRIARLAVPVLLVAACEGGLEDGVDNEDSGTSVIGGQGGWSQSNGNTTPDNVQVDAGGGGSFGSSSGSGVSVDTGTGGGVFPGNSTGGGVLGGNGTGGGFVDDPAEDAGSQMPSAPGGNTGTADISSCPPPPAGATPQAIRAWTMLNEIRLPMGAGCISLVPELMQSAQAHCDYLAANRGNRSCYRDAHTEVRGCPGFTGATVQAREEAAGYPRSQLYTEVALTYGNNPDLAIPGWLVTPYHRIPMVDPWTTEMGWGGGPSCDVIDFGHGPTRPAADTLVVYPYDGQVDVPVSFNGLESPQPPAPAGGWPSSFPVSIYADRLRVTEHVLSRADDGIPLQHVWLDQRSPGVPGFGSYFTNNALLYGPAFAPNTTYRVRMAGTYVGGSFDIEWTFTTGARPRFGFF